MDKTILVTMILDTHIKLNHMAGNVNMERGDLWQMESSLLNLELEDLQKLYVEVAKSAIETLRQIDIDAQALGKKGMREIEAVERRADTETSQAVSLM